MSEVATPTLDAIDTVVAATADAVSENVAKATPAKPKKAATPAKRTAKPRAKAAAKPAAKSTAKPAAKSARAPKRQAAAAATRSYVRKTAATVKATAAPVVTALNNNPFSQGNKIMDSTNWFAAFTSAPGADKVQTLFADAGAKGQDVVRKGQAIAETMTETTRANLEAVVESSRIAAAGARDLGQEIVASTKGGVEQATAAVKTLADAKSPTEFFQLQSELVRASFDRFVAEGSKLTEQMVKLAGEAAQPLSSRASVNAEKFSELTA